MCQFEEEDCEKQAWTRRCKENDKQTITRKYVNSCEKKVSSKLNKYSSRMVNLRFPVGRVPYRCKWTMKSRSCTQSRSLLGAKNKTRNKSLSLVACRCTGNEPTLIPFFFSLGRIEVRIREDGEHRANIDNNNKSKIIIIIIIIIIITIIIKSSRNTTKKKTEDTSQTTKEEFVCLID